VKWLPGGSSRGLYHDPYPVFVDYGEGHHFYDVDGNRYLDFMLNATSLIMGHANPVVVEAIQRQAERGTGFVGPNEAAVRLARILCERVPSLDKVRFVNSGSEATLNAIRAARAFTGRHKIAKFAGAYHGSHEYVAVSVKPSAEARPLATAEFPGQPPGVLEDVVVLPWNDLESCERVLRRNSGDLACVIIEPIASTLGYAPSRPGFLEGIREIMRSRLCGWRRAALRRCWVWCRT
jgi:glutamate-1-semialdehyde 2,1-aminomutase